MSGTYESLKLNSEESNVERLGTFVAWLVANNLLSSSLENSAGSSVARLRMQDLSGAEFLTTVMHGEFKVEHLTENAKKLVTMNLTLMQRSQRLSMTRARMHLIAPGYCMTK